MAGTFGGERTSPRLGLDGLDGTLKPDPTGPSQITQVMPEYLVFTSTRFCLGECGPSWSRSPRGIQQALGLARISLSAEG